MLSAYPFSRSHICCEKLGGAFCRELPRQGCRLQSCGIAKSNPSPSRSRERRAETAGAEVRIATADLALHRVVVFSPGLAERVVKSDAGIHVHQVCLVPLEFAFISEDRQERAVPDVFT